MTTISIKRLICNAYGVDYKHGISQRNDSLYKSEFLSDNPIACHCPNDSRLEFLLSGGLYCILISFLFFVLQQREYRLYGQFLIYWIVTTDSLFAAVCPEKGVATSTFVQHWHKPGQWAELTAQCRRCRSIHCQQLSRDTGTSEDQEGPKLLQGLALSQTLETNSGAIHQITTRREHAQAEQV